MTTIPVELRELLERCRKRLHDMMQADLSAELSVLLAEQPQQVIPGNVLVRYWHLAGEIDGRPVYWQERHDEQPQAGAGQEPYPECDYCGIVPDHHPWHGSGLLNGVESRHIHACNDCRNKLPPARHDQGDEVRRLRERMGAVVVAGNGLSNIAFNLAQLEGAPLTHYTCELMKMQREQWDKAVAALTHSPKGEEA